MLLAFYSTWILWIIFAVSKEKKGLNLKYNKNGTYYLLCRPVKPFKKKGRSVKKIYMLIFFVGDCF